MADIMGAADGVVAIVEKLPPQAMFNWFDVLIWIVIPLCIFSIWYIRRRKRQWKKEPNLQSQPFYAPSP